MHIVQVISHYVPAYRFGGPQHVAHGLGRALVRLGHSVTVLTTNLADERRDLDVPTNTEVDVQGVKVHYHRTKWSRYWGYSPELMHSCRTLIPAADWVFVHFHYQFANFAGASVARKAQVPYCIFAHGSFKQDAVTRKGRLRKWIYNRILERRNIADANAIIFNAVEEQRLSLPFRQSLVFPNGIEPNDYATQAPEGRGHDQQQRTRHKTTILFLGRLDFRGKGLDLLLPALRQLLDAGNSIHLYLAGPDERGGEHQTRQMVKELKLEGDVTFLGMVTGNEKMSLLSAVDCMVLPSRSEGLSITLLEALYLGVPILVTDQVGLHEEVRALGAGVVTPVSISGVVEGISQLCREETRDAMRGKARNYVQQNLTWDAIAQRMIHRLLARESK